MTTWPCIHFTAVTGSGLATMFTVYGEVSRDNVYSLWQVISWKYNQKVLVSNKVRGFIDEDISICYSLCRAFTVGTMKNTVVSGTPRIDSKNRYVDFLGVQLVVQVLIVNISIANSGRFEWCLVFLLYTINLFCFCIPLYKVSQQLHFVVGYFIKKKKTFWPSTCILVEDSSCFQNHQLFKEWLLIVKQGDQQNDLLFKIRISVSLHSNDFELNAVCCLERTPALNRNLV